MRHFVLLNVVRKVHNFLIIWIENCGNDLFLKSKIINTLLSVNSFYSEQLINSSKKLNKNVFLRQIVIFDFEAIFVKL